MCIVGCMQNVQFFCCSSAEQVGYFFVPQANDTLHTTMLNTKYIVQIHKLCCSQDFAHYMRLAEVKYALKETCPAVVLAGQCINSKADEEVPRFPFSIVKPRSNSQTSSASASGANQSSKTLDGLPVGAVALNASQPLPVITFPFADGMDAHTQAACHLPHEPPAAPSATETHLSATQQQPDEPRCHSSGSAVLAQLPASSSEVQQPLMPCLGVNGGLQPASGAVGADADNTGRTMPPDAVASSLLPAPMSAAQNSSAVSMLSSGKRLHDAVSQANNEAAQHKDQSEASHEALSKKPKLGQ